MTNSLDRVRAAARQDKEQRFTALLHHVSLDRLRKSFLDLKKEAAPGIDGVTWKDYYQDHERKLEELLGRIHRGGYRPVPSRRAYIEKADGSKRPLGIAALEDKIVQRAVVEVLNAIYEEDMVGFSYGFRPGRHQHQALDALAYGITKKKVNWILDADIRGYFDAINHEYLMTILECRIGDPRILRLIRKWLKAGVLDGESLIKAKEGTPQGAVISPLLANVFLHHVFDRWAHAWRKQVARGDIIIVRYADDFVVGFQHRDEAVRFKAELQKRLADFALELHPKKTRLIEFGRFAAQDRSKRGEGKPDSFDFLGFTHICGKTRKGWFLLRRQTQRSRLRAKLSTLRKEIFRRRHQPIGKVGSWLRAVIRGHMQYYGVPTNRESLWVFSREVAKAWLHALQRRGDQHKMSWTRFRRHLRRWFPPIRICHPWPETRLRARLRHV